MPPVPAAPQRPFFNIAAFITRLQDNYRLLLSLPLLMLLTWGTLSEWVQFRHAHEELIQSEDRAGAAYARIIENRLNNQFRTMEFAATLLNRHAPGLAPDPKTLTLLDRLKALHPEFYALSVYGADGKTRLWSFNSDPNFAQITPAREFSELTQPNYLLGQDSAPQHSQQKVISMRYRVRDTNQAPIFYLRAPYRLSALLQYDAHHMPWRLTVVDTRDQSILGVWQQQQLIVNDDSTFQAPPHQDTPTRAVPIHKYPLSVIVTADKGSVWHAYWRSAKLRLGIYLGILLLLSLATWGLDRAMRDRARSAQQLKRLAQFNALLAQVNQVIDRSSNDTDLLQTICDIAVQHGQLRLAFVARPDEAGWFHILASAGPAVEYTRDLKLSTRAGLPEGRGTAGTVWRAGDAWFVNEFQSHEDLRPWASKAAAWQIAASATLPIIKQGKIWAIFSVYHADKQIFDTPLRATLVQLANDLSFGLQQLDIQQREKSASATQTALLNNTLAGIALVTGQMFSQVNARLVALLGYRTAEELIGQQSRIIYFNEHEYQRVSQIYPSLIAYGEHTLLDVQLKKRDGELLYVDLAGSVIEGTRNQSTVWTFQDSSERKQLQRELKQSAEFQRALFEKNAAALIIVNAQRQIIDVNSALMALSGFERAALIGQNVGILQAAAHPGQPNDLTPPAQHTETDSVQRQDGSTRIVERLVSRVTLQNGEPGELWSLIDLTELHAAKQAITHQAMHDTLTNLPNRRALELWMPQAIARAQRKQTVIAVGLLDLDDFKPVNDRHGHAAGDQLLRELANRLRAHLRESDFVARLGGDEFVIVLEDIDDGRASEQLNIAMNRLHQAVEQPFEVTSGQWAKIDMSIGIALYPQDGDESDGLIRNADAALYRLKAQKTTRECWWHLVKAPHTPTDTADLANNAYAPTSQAALQQHAAFFAQIAAEFITVFYQDLERDAGIQIILSTLTPQAKTELIAAQTAHLLFVLSPQTTREMLLKRARKTGEIHALVGVGRVHLMQSLSLYRKLLTDFLNRSALGARDRYRLLMIAEARLEEDILTQAQAGGATIQSYFGLLSQPMPPHACFWIEAIAAEIQPLATRSGIRAVILFRPNSDGVMTVEASAGEHAHSISALLTSPGQEVLLDDTSARGQGLAAQAWRTSSIQTAAQLQTDPRYTSWQPHIQALRIQSVIAIPILNSAGTTIAVVCVYGAYPHQFESTWMQQFARNLQQRLNQIWLLCTIPNVVVDQQLAQHYRQVLFADGLRVFVQPVVDLNTGNLIKVEALARLQLPSGELLSPAYFLPLLGELELNRLFLQVLDVALHQLNVWAADGILVDISVNLAPITLADPQCPAWIEAALHKHGIAPARLTLEILETQAIDHIEQDAAINAIVALGVPLAMDDLGAGYSSLQRLASLPFNTIKVDQSLVNQIHRNPIQTLSLIAAIIQMGRDFDQRVVVEGLENEGTLEVARILGAHDGQGYGIARPMPIEELVAWQRSFRWMPATNTLYTALGALAFHWWFMHNGHSGHPDSAAACPLSDYLAHDPKATDEVRQWHAEVHQAGDNRAASRKLIAWLAERAIEAHPHAAKLA